MRPGHSTLLTCVVLALVAGPGAARAAGWGRKGKDTAANTSREIDKDVKGATSALRRQFGDAIAAAVADADKLGRQRGEGQVDHVKGKGAEGQKLKRVSSTRQIGAQTVTRTREVVRQKGGFGLTTAAEQDNGDGSSLTSKRTVAAEGRRRVTVSAVDRKQTANGGVERASSKTMTRGAWGKGRVEESTERTTRVGAFTSNGNTFEEETASVWGRGKNKKNEKTWVTSVGQKRRIVSTETRRFGGLVVTNKATGFATNRRGQEKEVGSSKSITVAGKTFKLGRQRADREPPRRWGATASAGRPRGRGGR